MANPNTADIRQYLTNAYSDEEITVLCTDYFRDVSDNFAVGLTKGQKIQLLLDHCQRRELIPNLLAALQKDRPEQYRKRFGAGGSGVPRMKRAMAAYGLPPPVFEEPGPNFTATFFGPGERFMLELEAKPAWMGRAE